VKLFYAPGSSSLLPHIVPRDAELPFEPIRIDEHTKAISGGGDFRIVPAIVLRGGTLLTEGAAIVQYIADLVPEKKLAPEWHNRESQVAGLV
jgi:glutathione S-transferase